MNDLTEIAEEFEKIEKYFRCLKEQVLEFQQKAIHIIPDVDQDYKKEVKQVLKDLLLAKSGEEIKNLLNELKKFVRLTEENKVEIKEKE